MNKHGLVGAILVLVAGCDMIIGATPLPALNEHPDCLKWDCDNGPCGYVLLAEKIPCDNGRGICDGKGNCMEDIGGGCRDDSECFSGFCTDGVCCDEECMGTCKACNILGKAGTCSDVAHGTDDEFADTPCTGSDYSCDGEGVCKHATSCNEPSDCLSGFCADGVCCDSACTDACKACNIEGKVGTCSDIKVENDDAVADNPCTGDAFSCDGDGHCKGELGTPSSGPNDCLSGFWADGVCCNETCTGGCRACSAAAKGQGSDGTCGVVAYKKSDPEQQCTNGACDGQGGCKSNDGQPCTVDSQCLSNYCVDGFCCNTECNGKCEACSNAVKGQGPNGTCGPIVLGQDPATECEAGSCGGDGACKKDIGQTCTTSGECLSNSCQGGYCTGPSCLNLAATCGAQSNESCCASAIVPTGGYYRDVGMQHRANVDKFRLDKFEVTVGRFREFVEAYPASKPAAGAGAHSQIPNSGWKSAWTLPAGRIELESNLKACGSRSTWMNPPSTYENRPINCVSWEIAFAFCAWDGGRLPTEAEWQRAAAGDSGNRYYPWHQNDSEISSSRAVYDCGGDTTCDINDILLVGSKPNGVGSWGHMDLGGSVWEWVLDYSGVYPAQCDNCAQLSDQGSGRILRGGGWRSRPASGMYPVYELSTFGRGTTNYAYAYDRGLRCARNP